MADVLYEELSYAIVGAAMEVHRCLGPGFLETVYHQALAHELALRRIPFELERRLHVEYKGQAVGEFEADLVVDDKVIVELKSVSASNPAHMAQVHNYLAATGLRLGLILNFGTPSLQMKRIIK